MAVIQRFVANALIINQFPRTNIKVLNVNHTVSFISDGKSHAKPQNPENILPLRHVVQGTYGRYRGIVSSTLSFLQSTHPRAHITHASSDMGLGQIVARPKHQILSQKPNFTQTLIHQQAKSASNIVPLVSIVLLDVIRILSPFSNLELKHGASVYKVDKTHVVLTTPLPPPPVPTQVVPANEHLVPPPSGVVISSTPPLLNYSVQNALPSPTIRQTFSVAFQYPEATMWLVLPRPEKDNEKRFDFTRINRRSRGGDLILFRDSLWPKTKTLALSFILHKFDQIDGINYFFKQTVGKKIRYHDHYGRIWEGYIMTPAAPISQQSINEIHVNIEYQGVPL